MEIQDIRLSRDKSAWKKELMKMLLVAVTAVLCLLWIVNHPSLGSIITSVLVIASLSWCLEKKNKVHRYPVRNRAVLVTGCDSGFGQELALSLSEQGAVVFAGCLNTKSEGARQLISKQPPTRMHVLQMDVTKIEDIIEVKEYIEGVVGEKGIWGVVNNAGLNFLGDVELSTLEQFEKVNDVNYLGMVRVTKTFIPMVRKTKGRFVNVTSVKGLVGLPFNAAYCATKYAGEVFTDILRMEMKKFDVSVSAIEPCDFGGATKCIESCTVKSNASCMKHIYLKELGVKFTCKVIKSASILTRIKGDFESMWTDLSQDQKDMYGRDYIDAHLTLVKDAAPLACFDTHLVTDAMEDALFNVKPKTRYLIPGGSGWNVWFNGKSYLKRFLPDWLMDKWLLSEVTNFPQGLQYNNK